MDIGACPVCQKHCNEVAKRGKNTPRMRYASHLKHLYSNYRSNCGVGKRCQTPKTLRDWRTRQEHIANCVMYQLYVRSDAKDHASGDPRAECMERIAAIQRRPPKENHPCYGQTTKPHAKEGSTNPATDTRPGAPFNWERPAAKGWGLGRMFLQQFCLPVPLCGVEAAGSRAAVQPNCKTLRDFESFHVPPI